MKYWEYSWDTIKNINGIIDHQELLENRGKDGWELVSIIKIQLVDEKRLRFYWKRELNLSTYNKSN